VYLLALDIGNTNVTAGLFEGARLISQFRVRTETARTPDEYASLLASLISLRVDPAAFAAIDAVAIASVVPAVTATIERACREYIGVAPLIVSAATTETGLTIAYEPPASLGADRLVNAYAAYTQYAGSGRGCIVVDYGTATKLEVVSATGVYRGGVILPGVGISLDALFSRGAQLRQIPLTPIPASAIGGTTADALRAGILFGYAAQTDGLVARFRREMPEKEVCVIATGGLAELIAPHAACIDRMDLNLTVTGLRLLHKRNA
jgi:type III pantothenate kinase